VLDLVRLVELLRVALQGLLVALVGLLVALVGLLVQVLLLGLKLVRLLRLYLLARG
jgi:hypothetical protein